MRVEEILYSFEEAGLELINYSVNFYNRPYSSELFYDRIDLCFGSGVYVRIMNRANGSVCELYNLFLADDILWEVKYHWPINNHRRRRFLRRTIENHSNLLDRHNCRTEMTVNESIKRLKKMLRCYSED